MGEYAYRGKLAWESVRVAQNAISNGRTSVLPHILSPFALTVNRDTPARTICECKIRVGRAI